MFVCHYWLLSSIKSETVVTDLYSFPALWMHTHSNSNQQKSKETEIERKKRSQHIFDPKKATKKKQTSENNIWLWCVRDEIMHWNQKNHKNQLNNKKLGEQYYLILFESLLISTSNLSKISSAIVHSVRLFSVRQESCIYDFFVHIWILSIQPFFLLYSKFSGYDNFFDSLSSILSKLVNGG